MHASNATMAMKVSDCVACAGVRVARFGTRAAVECKLCRYLVTSVPPVSMACASPCRYKPTRRA